jgi:hypothetical protein
MKKKKTKKEYDIGYAVLVKSDLDEGHFETTMDINTGKQILIFGDEKSAKKCVKEAKDAGIQDNEEVVKKVKITLWKS